MKKQHGYTLIEVFMLIVLLAVIPATIGWVWNIVKLAQADFEKPYKTEILRGIAIPVAPLGAIIGYMDIGEEEEQ